MTEDLQAGPAAEGLQRRVCFVLTDVEGSTRLWERDAPTMSRAMARHDQLIQQAVHDHGGKVVRERGEGDSSFSVFTDATAATAAALDIQLNLAREPWTAGAEIRVRAAVHVGDADYRDGDYYGSAVNRCARLRSLAAGGQTVISTATQAQIVQRMPQEAFLIDLGSHRLKDLAEPERVYQLSHPGLPSEFPDLRGLETVPNNLPVQLTTFVGRAAEVPALVELVRTERLVTLTGAGGCGKTRLALEVAATSSDDYDGGVWFVDLSAIRDPALVAASTAAILGIRENASAQAGGDGENAAGLARAVVESLAGQRALLVFDNCEHVIEATAALVREILAVTHLVKVVSTSREILDVPGEAVWRVPSLAVPDPQNPPSLDLLLNYDAVRMFVERSQHQAPGFRLTSENATAVIQICARVDGLPLAVELAAARMRVLTAGQIADRIGDQFNLLARSTRGVPSRQATLRATIDWSYNLLDEDEARLFRRLAVFRGGCTLDSAEAICGEDVLDLLGHLVDKSMLQPDAGPSDRRFRLLEPLRLYAFDLLSEVQETEGFRDRHRSWFATFAEAIGADLVGGKPQEATLARCDAELDNLRAAFDWSIARGHADALRICASLRAYWLYRGFLHEGRARLEEAIDALPAAPSQLRMEAMMGAGRLATEMGDVTGARAHHDRARELAVASGDPRHLATALRYQAHLAHQSGDASAAARLIAQAVDAARQSGHRYTLTVSLLDASQMAMDRGDPAPGWLDEGLRLARRDHDRRNLSLGLYIQARVALGAGDLPVADSAVREAIEIARAVSDRRIVGECLVLSGELCLSQGDLAGALEALREAMRLSVDIGVPELASQALAGIAAVECARGDYQLAATLAGASEGAHTRLDLGAQPAQKEQLAAIRERCRAAVGPNEYLRLHDLGYEMPLVEASALAAPTLR